MTDAQSEYAREARDDKSADEMFSLMRPPQQIDPERLLPGAKALIAEARNLLASLETKVDAAHDELIELRRMRAEVEGGWLYRMLTWGWKK